MIQQTHDVSIGTVVDHSFPCDFILSVLMLADV